MILTAVIRYLAIGLRLECGICSLFPVLILAFRQSSDLGAVPPTFPPKKQGRSRLTPL